MLTEQERVALDARLSGGFKKGDVIIRTTDLGLIGVFDKVAYHGGDPEDFVSIFPDFTQAISRYDCKWHVLENGCGDDDVYIDRTHDLTEKYRKATPLEERLFNALIQWKKNDKI